MELNQVVALRMVQIYLLARVAFLLPLSLLEGEEAERFAGALAGVTGNTVSALASWYIARANRRLVPKGTDVYFALVGLGSLLLSPLWLLLGTALALDALVVYGIFRVWRYREKPYHQ